MNRIKIFIVLILMDISLQANYCIQVLTVDQNELHSIIAKASSRNYADFNDVRVESRGRYLVFRIGDYKRYQDARDDIARVRETARNAYIRKCDFIKEQAVFIANNGQQAPYYEPPRQEVPYYEPARQEAPRQEAPRQEAPRQEAPRQEVAPYYKAPRQEVAPYYKAPRQEVAPYYKAPRQEAPRQEVAPYYKAPRQKAPRQEIPTQYEQPRSRVRKPIVQNIQKKEEKRRGYKQREELISPYRRDNSLWNDCKKCFVPVYGDEEDTDAVQSSDNMQQKPRKIQVRKHKPKQVSKQESFWAEDVPVAKTPTPKPKRKNRTKNKFHINEQFLP